MFYIRACVEGRKEGNHLIFSDLKINDLKYFNI